MELRDLRYFSSVVRSGHFGKTAREFGVTQPAVTKAIQRLESEFGTLLFQRTTKGVVPTSAGLALNQRAREIEVAVDTTKRQIIDLATGSAGYIRIGTGSTMADYLLPHACADLLTRFSGVTIQIVGNTHGGLMKALRNGDLDLTLSALPDKTPDDLVQESLGDDELVIVARTTHPLAGKKDVSFEELSQQRWALPSQSIAQQLLEHSFRQHGFTPPRIVIETNSVAMLLATVARSDLLTFQPLANLRLAASRLKLCELKVKKARWYRRIGISYRRDTYLSPAAVKLIAFLRKATRDIHSISRRR